MTNEYAVKILNEIIDHEEFCDCPDQDTISALRLAIQSIQSMNNSIDKTNFQMLKNLLDSYQPVTTGFVSHDEIELISKKLCLAQMNILQLRNMRDTVVMVISSQCSNDDGNVKIHMDKMSAITHVIDTFIIRNGGEI